MRTFQKTAGIIITIGIDLGKEHVARNINRALC
jgi:hypothetical protein